MAATLWVAPMGCMAVAVEAVQEPVQEPQEMAARVLGKATTAVMHFCAVRGRMRRVAAGVEQMRADQMVPPVLAVRAAQA